LEVQQLATLDWSEVNPEGSRFAKGKSLHYALVVSHAPEDTQRDCVIGLFSSTKDMSKMKIYEIKMQVQRDEAKLERELVVYGNSPPQKMIDDKVAVAKSLAQRLEERI
jgi:hypothetical protein